MKKIEVIKKEVPFIDVILKNIFEQEKDLKEVRVTYANSEDQLEVIDLEKVSSIYAFNEKEKTLQKIGEKVLIDFEEKEFPYDKIIAIMQKDNFSQTELFITQADKFIPIFKEMKEVYLEELVNELYDGGISIYRKDLEE